MQPYSAALCMPPSNIIIRVFLQAASSLLFRFAKLMHEKSKPLSGKAKSRNKRGRKPSGEEKIGRRVYSLQNSLQSVFSHLVLIPYCNITSWFAIALAGMRTRQNLREKADCKKSRFDEQFFFNNNVSSFYCCCIGNTELLRHTCTR